MQVYTSYVCSLRLAVSSKHCCIKVQPHCTANVAVDSLLHAAFLEVSSNHFISRSCLVGVTGSKETACQQRSVADGFAVCRKSLHSFLKHQQHPPGKVLSTFLSVKKLVLELVHNDHC